MTDNSHMEFIFPPTIRGMKVKNETALFPIGKIYCVGKNYAAHAKEMGSEVDKKEPFFFSKPPQALTQLREIPYPVKTNNLHHEVELVVFLKKGGANILIDQAEDLIFGFKFNLGNGILAYFILIPIILVSGFILMILFLAINFSIYLLILSVYYSQSYEAFTLSMDWEALLSPFRLFFDLGIVNSILMVLFLVISFCFSLILPWIIVSIPFAMTFYIMAEDTSTDAWDAIQQSWKMMKGFKRSYLWLNVILLFMVIPISIFTLFMPLVGFMISLYKVYKSENR